MIALVASLLLTIYLLVPSTVFRLVCGFFVPLRNFIRTRGEEIFQGVASALAPAALALLLVWTTPPFKQHPFGFDDTSQLRRADYKLLFGATYSEDVYKRSDDQFWKALTRSAHRQGRFVVWYYLFILLEGCLFGRLCVLYPRLSNRPFYPWMAQNILLPTISEWHLLLTPFYFEDKKTIVRADILCSDHTLYRGRVWQHSLSKDGQLSGLILTEAKRYARDAYLEDKKKGEVSKENYWRAIPGSKFYILADKILNLNLSYEPTQEPTPKAMAELISKQLNQPISLTIERKPQTDDTSASPLPDQPATER